MRILRTDNVVLILDRSCLQKAHRLYSWIHTHWGSHQGTWGTTVERRVNGATSTPTVATHVVKHDLLMAQIHEISSAKICLREI